MGLSPQQIEAYAKALMAQTTPQGILRIRRQLDATSAQQVIRAVPPLERAALLLCVAFRNTDRWAPFDSAIIPGSPEEIWGELNGDCPVPSDQQQEDDGQLTSGDKRRTAPSDPGGAATAQRADGGLHQRRIPPGPHRPHQ